MASVIKAGKMLPGGTTIQHTEFNLEDMSTHASQYLEKVREQAAHIVAQARQQAQQLAAQAAEQGRQAAEQAARQAAIEDAAARWQSLMPALQQAIEDAAQLRSSWLHSWEQQVVRLAMAVAERVIRGELSRQPQISEQWIREALELASGCNTITLRLHPADYEALGDLRETVTHEFANLAATDIVPDANITPGGCRVETQYGYIDKQLATQLSRIEEELIG
jgi:flagellar assembly protein FliH